MTIMSKKIFQFISIPICIAFFLTSVAFGSDARASSHINMCSATLLKNSDGDLSLTFVVVSNGVMDAVGASSIIIQRNNGSGWMQECMLTIYNTPELQASETTQHIATVVYVPIYKNANYRALVNIYAKNSTGSDSRQIITNVV